MIEAAPHMREGEAKDVTEQQVYDAFGFLEGLVNEATFRQIARTAYRLAAPPKADAVDLPPGMMLIQKSDAECLVHDHERYAVGHTASTVGGRLAAKRVRELLSLDSSRSKP